jgi:predicted CopG family antitoxin
MKSINFSMDDEVYEELRKFKDEYSRDASWLDFFYFKITGKKVNNE